MRGHIADSSDYRNPARSGMLRMFMQRFLYQTLCNPKPDQRLPGHAAATGRLHRAPLPASVVLSNSAAVMASDLLMPGTAHRDDAQRIASRRRGGRWEDSRGFPKNPRHCEVVTMSRQIRGAIVGVAVAAIQTMLITSFSMASM
ncbi:MAG: hypothetical protein ACK5MY_12510 [Jhaorihella sp.]